MIPPTAPITKLGKKAISKVAADITPSIIASTGNRVLIRSASAGAPGLNTSAKLPISPAISPCAASSACQRFAYNFNPLKSVLHYIRLRTYVVDIDKGVDYQVSSR
jgi:hypothetical protein